MKIINSLNIPVFAHFFPLQVFEYFREVAHSLSKSNSAIRCFTGREIVAPFFEKTHYGSIIFSVNISMNGPA